MEDNHYADLAAMQRARTDLLEQIRLSIELIEQSNHLLGRIDEMLAQSPLRS